jgi:hypothetical protein
MEDKEPKTQKLESIAKIMMATGAINYMACALNDVNEQMKFVPDKDGYHLPGIQAKDQLLADTVTALAAIMEKLGNMMNAHDCICPIDIYATQAAFNVLIQGNDDVNHLPDIGDDTTI